MNTERVKRATYYDPFVKPKPLPSPTEEVRFALDCINHVIEEYRDDPGEWFPDCACLGVGDTSEEILERLRQLRRQFFRLTNAD